MSKYTSEVYNNSSDTDSTIYIENNEETSEEEEVIINKNNNTDVFLNFPLELEQYFVNNLSVQSNLIIPLFLNLPYTLVKKYNMECCHFTTNNNYHYTLTSLISDTSILSDLIEEQHTIY